MAIGDLLWPQEISYGHRRSPTRLSSFAMQVGGSRGRSPPGKQGGFGGAASPPNGGGIWGDPGGFLGRKIWGGKSGGENLGEKSGG